MPLKALLTVLLMLIKMSFGEKNNADKMAFFASFLDVQEEEEEEK